MLFRSDISFNVREHEIRAIIGPNGAGKSSLLNCINGVYTPQEGSITFRGKTFNHLDSPQVARMGIARTFQNLALFKGMSVLDNIMTGRNLRMKSNLFLQALRLGPAQREEIAHREKVERIIDFLEIQAHRKTPVGQLPYGLQKRVDLGRALALEPQVLLLDEPTTGLDPQARHLMWERLQLLLQQGKSILLTTHFMDEAERLCTRLLILDHGRKIAEGRPRDLIAQYLEPDVVEVYGVGALALTDSPLKSLAARVEVSGETVFFYTHEAQPLLHALEAQPQLRTLHRPANLEDLFLKFTGRQIREGG